MAGCSEWSLVSMVVQYHSIIVWAHMLILCKITEHLIRHLWQAGIRLTIHLHISHHACHAELLLVKSIHHTCVWREWHLKAAVWSRACTIGTALVRWQALHPLLRIHVHELALDHLCKSVHLLKILFFSQNFHELFCGLWTRRVVCRLTL